MVMLNLENKLSKRFTVTMYVFVITYEAKLAEWWDPSPSTNASSVRFTDRNAFIWIDFQEDLKRSLQWSKHSALGSIPLRRDEVSFYQTL